MIDSIFLVLLMMEILHDLTYPMILVSKVDTRSCRTSIINSSMYSSNLGFQVDEPRRRLRCSWLRTPTFP